jgi:hypothetical protein
LNLRGAESRAVACLLPGAKVSSGTFSTPIVAITLLGISLREKQEARYSWGEVAGFRFMVGRLLLLALAGLQQQTTHYVALGWTHPPDGSGSFVLYSPSTWHLTMYVKYAASTCQPRIFSTIAGVYFSAP